MIAVIIKKEKGKLNGVAYHRLYVPFMNLKKKGFDIRIFNEFSEINVNVLKDCRAIVMSRGFIPTVGYKGFLEVMHAHGVQVVLDQDDYWKLDSWHPAIEAYKEDNREVKILNSIQHSDWVTTTHKRLAKKVQKVSKGKKVLVLPNAIDASKKQWSSKKKESDVLRFGYVAGASHARDLDELGGYNFKQEGKELYVANVMNFADILGATKKLPITDVENYGFMYDEFDVALAPLKASEFNKCKSDLKVLEAGFKKCAFIGSNVHPYTFLIKSGYNGILCSNAKEWREAIEGMTKEKAKLMGERLFETVQQFEINEVNKIREKFFFS